MSQLTNRRDALYALCGYYVLEDLSIDDIELFFNAIRNMDSIELIKLILKELAKVRKELEGANDVEREKYQAQINALELNLQEAIEKGKRALSMAEQTKQGHVYVISNIGSFGEDVYKRAFDPRTVCSLLFIGL